MTHAYARYDYAVSLTHLGRALPVPEWGCSVIVRPIADQGFDAIGCYPIAVLDPQADLAGGLERLRKEGLVSVMLVLDDVHRPPVANIEEAFATIAPYKTHYTVDPRREPATSKHHQREIKRANGLVDVRPIQLADMLGEWTALYTSLAERHDFGALHRFPDRHFAALAQLPGVHTIGAFSEGALVCAHLWVEHAGCVYSHLAASSDEGYRCGAAYAVNAFSIDHFRDARLINLGGAAGADEKVDGLARFKAGFANGTSRSWLVSEVLDPARYAQLAEGLPPSAFFPAYRQPGAPFANG